MIYAVTLNPAWDKTVTIPDLSFGKVNRIQAMREDIGGKGINVSKCISTLGGETTANAPLVCGAKGTVSRVDAYSRWTLHEHLFFKGGFAARAWL